MNELYKKAIECSKYLRESTPRKIRLTPEEWKEFEILAGSDQDWNIEHITSLLLSTEMTSIDLHELFLKLLQKNRAWIPFLLGAAQTHILTFHQRQGTRIPFSFVRELGTILFGRSIENALFAMETFEMIGPQGLILSGEIKKLARMFTFPWQRDKRQLKLKASVWIKHWKI